MWPCHPGCWGGGGRGLKDVNRYINGFEVEAPMAAGRHTSFSPGGWGKHRGRPATAKRAVPLG